VTKESTLEPCGEPGTTAVIAAPAGHPSRVLGGMALVALLTVYIVWGSTYLAIRFALQAYPPMFFPALRFLFAGGVLLTVMKLRGAALPTPRQWRNAAILAFLLLIVGNGGVVLAEQSVGSGLAATAVATVPLWTALFGMFWGETPNRLQWLGMVVGFAGIVVLNLGSDLSGDLSAALLLVASAVCWSYGSLLGKRIDLPAGLMNPAAQMFCAGFLFLFASALRGEHWVLAPSAKALLWVLYLAVFGSIIAFSAFVYLMNTTPAALATSYSYVNPVIAVLLGVAFGGETVTHASLVAMALVVTGVALILAFTPRHR
jgi:drug/metabolite transporter (DMT)-like permease